MKWVGKKMDGSFSSDIYQFITCEKCKKILDIWHKSNTFPSAVLARLHKVVKEADKGAYHVSSEFAEYFSVYAILPFAPNKVSDVRAKLKATLSVSEPNKMAAVTADPRAQSNPSNITPREPVSAPVQSPESVQSALLALLSQAANAAAASGNG